MQGVSHSLRRIPSLDHPGDLPYSPRLATAGWRESLQHQKVYIIIWSQFNTLYVIVMRPKWLLVTPYQCLKMGRISYGGNIDYLHSMLAASIPSRSLRSNNDNSLSVPRGQDQYWCKSFSLLCPVSLEQPPAVCPFSCYLQEISEDASLWFGLSPIDTVTPHGLLMLRNCFLDFAV